MFIWYGLVGAILIVLVSFIRRTKDKYEDICNAAGLACFCLVPLLPGRLLGLLYPRTLDWYLYLADRSMGIDLVPLARYAWSTPWVWRPLQVVYGSIPLMLAIAWTAEKSLIMRRAVVIAAVSGYFFYMLVPACGPQYAFPGFPWAEIHGSGLVSVSTLYARNCFPSLHFSWALLLLINARSNWLRAIMCCFTILTALGTVLGGEHYVIDLIAAVPFVIGVQAVSKRWPCMVAARRVPARRPVPSDC